MGPSRRLSSRAEQYTLAGTSPHKTVLPGTIVNSGYRQLTTRRELMLFKDVPLRARRALSLYKVYKLTFQVNCPVPKFLTLGYLKGQLLAPQVIQYIHFQ